jgi:hypothetical protein
VCEHHVARITPQRAEVARMAVRLMRWLGAEQPSVESVADGIARHCVDWGWVDRALAVLWHGDPVSDPAVAHAYRTIYQAARARRDTLDERFAQHLVPWVATASQHAPGSCLLIEDVLDRVVRPLGGKPLVLVLDGMSSAVAVQLGEQLPRSGWIEVSPGERRQAAVAMLPSITTVSRASLLSGRAASGDQSVEKDGFTAFWRRHRKDAVLFHSAEITGAGGSRLAEPLEEAVADDRRVVAVVLNTIDVALDHGREGDSTSWCIENIRHLADLLDAALMYGRPVVVVADHGHVLERSASGTGPRQVESAESARWRTGQPGDGEIELAGPRVLCGDGRIVVPWREDIHYTRRRAGYHGGASLAELTVPVLVAVPTSEQVPAGWSVLTPDAMAPAWWERQVEPAAEATPVPRPRRVRPMPATVTEPLFTVDRAPSTAPASLGAQVVASTVYQAQRQYVRKPPAPEVIATVIDELAAADGTMPLAAVAAAAGRAGRNPAGLAATLERLLNVDGYGVIGVVDGGVTLRLNVEVLREQFQVDS